MKLSVSYRMLAVLPMLLALLPEQAHAVTLTCSNGNVASGELYKDDGCNSGSFQGIEHIFSMIICQFVEIINRVMSAVYCSIQNELRATLKAVFTVYIAVFGAQLLMGTVQLSAKEFMVRMLKVAGVWMFVNYTLYGIGIAFNFFISLSVYGIYWVWGGLEPTDPLLQQIGLSSGGGVMPLFLFFDELLYDIITGPFTAAHSAVLGFFFVMWYLVPTIFMMAAYWLWISFTIMVRTLISFLISLAAFAFLISLSPIFLSFMLFSATYDFFENWLKYMMSYTIQIIVIFAVIALWLASVKIFIGFFDELAQVLFPYDSLWMEGAPKSDPTSTWSICPIDIQTSTLGPTVTCQDPNFDIQNPDHKKKLIPAARIAEQGDFLYFIVFRLITLIIICYAFDTLVREAPYMARSLAGPEYVPILGQGYGFSKYGVIQKSPWYQKGMQMNQGVFGKLNRSLGISGGIKNAISGMANQYNSRMGQILSKR